MKKLITITFASLLFYSIDLIAQGIKFEENLSWTQIQAKAKTENKYIFVDTYATWCGPCKVMSADVFPKKEVGDFINDRFISVKVQMDQTINDNELVNKWYTDAKFIGERYKINAYPTILFFSPDGHVAGRSTGYKDTNQLITEARNAIANSEEFTALYDQYKSGMRDSAFVKKLALMGRKVGETEIVEKVSQQYIGSLDSQELFKKDNLRFVYQFTTSSKDKGFSLFKKYGERVNGILGNNAVEWKIREVIAKEEIEPFIKSNSDVPDWRGIEKRVETKYGELGLEEYYGKRMYFSLDKKDWVDFGKYYALYYISAFSRSEYHINNTTWSVFEYVNDPNVLKVAIETQKYSMDNYAKDEPTDMDTYANLLYKIGFKDRAILWEEKVVKLSNNNKEFVETLEKMKTGTPTWPLAEPKK